MPNAYQRRLAMRREGQRQRHSMEREEFGCYVDQILQRYEDAYAALHNGERIRLKYKSGWVRLGSINVHLPEVVRRAALLEARFHERELNVPEEVL